ncbi:MAG TPA: hypothetical protein VL946_01480, partial [Lacibacter sp.]|nr:hypothetical protein [Lacibacter sp.]
MKYSVFACLFFVLVLVSCKGKKQKEIKDEDLTAADFVMLAKDLSHPVLVNDSLLNAKEKDSVLINQETFKTFLPDSVYQTLYPKTKNLKLYLIGKSADGDKGNYVLIKSAIGKERGAQLL